MKRLKKAAALHRREKNFTVKKRRKLWQGKREATNTNKGNRGVRTQGSKVERAQ